MDTVNTRAGTTEKKVSDNLTLVCVVFLRSLLVCHYVSVVLLYIYGVENADISHDCSSLQY